MPPLYVSVCVARRHAVPAAGPVRSPPPETSFAGYPSAWLAGGDRLRATADALPRLAALLTMPLTNLAAERRCHDHDTLATLLRRAAAPQPVADLAGELARFRAVYEKDRPGKDVAERLRLAHSDLAAPVWASQASAKDGSNPSDQVTGELERLATQLAGLKKIRRGRPVLDRPDLLLVQLR